MSEDELQANRRARLGQWLSSHGGPTAVGTERRLKPSYLSYLSQLVGGYSFGGRSARNCESLLGMPTGWLDQTAGSAISAPAPKVPSPQILGEIPLQAALDVILSAVADIGTSRWAMARAGFDEVAANREAKSEVIAHLAALLEPTSSKRQKRA
jgi:hypothetical protein